MKRISCSIFLAFVFAFSLAAQTTLPDTPPGRLLSAWLASLASGDLAAHTKFLRERSSEAVRRGMSPEDAAARDMNFRERVGGGFDVLKVLDSSSIEIRALLRERSGAGFAEADLRVDPAKPDVIASLDLHRIPPPADALPPKNPDELVGDIAAFVDPLAAKDKFSGVVMIAKDGKPLFSKAWGFADRDEKIPNRVDTKFRLGSMNKMFTAVAVCQLVEQGKLQFTDTIAKALPDYPNHDIAAKITIAQLLTHTSGFGDFFGPDFKAKANSLRELKDYLPLFVDKPLRFEPGTKWAYSNTGFIVLGLIIERASGKNYFEYVREHIYKKSGMNDSGTLAKTDHVPNLAIGYTRDDSGGLISNYNTLPLLGSSAGGGDSTGPDLVKFAQALRTHSLLSTEMTACLTTGKVDTGMGDKYAYGFAEETVNGQRIVGHNGGAPGMNANLDIYWDSGYVVVVLSNFDPPAAGNVAEYIRLQLEP